MDYRGFYSGHSFTDYEYLGAHFDGSATVFRTFAPNAGNISVIGEFSSWQPVPMNKIYDGNFWECRIPDAKPGMMYKFKITSAGGNTIDHCDPYGFFTEKRPGNASIIVGNDGYEFTDKKWMRKRTDMKDSPLNVYEVHLGSWKKKTEESDGWYNYCEIADMLIPYVKDWGYNYIEIMPISEYPADESWGYQSTGFFSPTSRYGTPDQLKEFIDKCHRNDIGVILDFVPVHFAVDDFSLWNYDGTPLYEYPNSDVGVSLWGSCNFMHSRGEVRSFLQSAANYWLTEFHFDGLRMDAVRNLIYWQGDENRGENKDALEFLKVMNSGLKRLHPTAMLIAEDSTSRIGTTEKVEKGGLGFDYKWDLGWMNDTLDYFRLHPSDRNAAFGLLNFSMHYFYDEHFILPLSHDEVVHGKATIMQKMWGDYDNKFPQAKALYMYMYAHPGKKLNFMGNEIGQLREWDEKREQDWDILKYPVHDEFSRYIKELNSVYLNHPALYEKDYSYEGFEWKKTSGDPGTFAFERRCGSERILCLFNFSNEDIDDFIVEIYKTSELIPVITSNTENCNVKIRGSRNAHVQMPAFSAVMFKIEE